MRHSKQYSNLLIFGAGINQLTLIEAAKRLCDNVVTIDPDPNAPGRHLADSFYCIGAKDYDTTKTIVKKHNIAAIASSQMERPMRLMARLAQECNFTFHPPNVVEKSLDKFLMKKAFMLYDVPCARAILFSEKQHITFESMRGFTFPIIIKPRDGFSSRGVFKIEKFEEIDSFLAITRSFSTNGDVLLEEFIDGPEYSVETITYHGYTTIVQITEKYITPYPRTVELGHLQPAALLDFEKLQIENAAKKSIESLNIDNSAGHIELKLTSEGPKILEIGARSGGGFISSYLVESSTGINMDEAIIRLAFDDKPELLASRSCYSCIKFIELPAGRKVSKIKPLDDLLSKPEVVFAHIYLNVGDVIPILTDNSKRSACIIVRADDRKQVLELIQKYTNKLLERIEVI